jgi:hypothetical protein
MKRATIPVRDAVIYLGNDFVSMPYNAEPNGLPRPVFDTSLQSATITATSAWSERAEVKSEYPAGNSSGVV